MIGRLQRRVGDYATQLFAVAAVEALKIRHDPLDLLTRAVQPLLWLTLFGQVMGRVRSLNLAAGSYLDTSGHHHSLVEHQGTGGWSGIRTVSPHDAATGAGGFAELHGISCVGRACATVGDYQDTTDALRPLLNAYPGGATYAPALPVGAKNSSAALLSVSCSADSFCMGVGYYTSPTSPSLALVGHT